MYIRISATKSGNNLVLSCSSDGQWDVRITKAQIRRSINGANSYQTIYTKNISTVNDLTFSYTDSGVQYNRAYDYRAVVLASNDTVIGGSDVYNVSTSMVAASSYSVDLASQGIVIADSTGTWVSYFGNKYTKQMNSQVSYVTTLSGVVPRRVSNAQTNYRTGTVTGLFLPLNASCEVDIENAEQYKEEVLEMLNNGEPKILTIEGKQLCVSIDSGARETSSDFYGASTITFNYTQIGIINGAAQSSSGNGISFTIGSNGVVSFS